MGKGFNNFMSKKDFHPSAIWNLKKVWEAHQQQDLERKRQEEMRVQYEKEQEILNNKALLGDEKARIGLSFMYDAPAGISKERKEDQPEIEPKFEWQRKYNAPREAWAKGNEDIRDQPFGIQVRNVRCVKCHTWGHLNTDRECPLYNMSGNYEDAGISTNPSDLIKEARRKREHAASTSSSQKEDLPTKKERMNPDELQVDMKEEYGLSLKKSVIDKVKADDAIQSMGKVRRSLSSETSDEKPEKQKLMFDFLQSLSEKERAKIFNKLFESTTSAKDKSKKKKKKKHRKKDRKEKSRSKRHDSSGESESSPEIRSKWKEKDFRDLPTSSSRKPRFEPYRRRSSSEREDRRRNEREAPRQRFDTQHERRRSPVDTRRDGQERRRRRDYY